MIIHNHFTKKMPLQQHKGLVVTRDGLVQSKLSSVQTEHIINVFVNGNLNIRLVCSPHNISNLVIGRLYSEEFIDDICDIKSIQIDEKGASAFVELLENETSNFALKQLKNNNLNLSHDITLKPILPIAWKPEWVFALADRLAHDTPMHQTTAGTHSCFLSIRSAFRCCQEDLSRHNAFDKVLGFALSNNLDLTKAIIYTSGRLPVDMVTKAIRSSIPILVSKAVPTDQTVALAQKYKLTLICCARPDSMIVYNDPTHSAQQCIESQQLYAPNYENLENNGQLL